MRLDLTPKAERVFGLGSQVLSVAIPIDASRRPNGTAVRAFFHGLLPEGAALSVIERRFDVEAGDDFGLLGAIGRDCAGAVLTLPDDEEPTTGGGIEPLADGDLEREIENLPNRPLGADDKIRVSLPGVQPKLLLAKGEDGRWGQPVDGYPSTHILKPQDMRYPAYARAEALCLELARALTLTDVEVEVLVVGGRPILVVSRYDRVRGPEGVERLHQEDMAQALTIDELSGGSKYQDRGGRSLRDVAALLRAHTRASDLRGLLRLTTLNVAVGNADAHAKNIGLLHPRDGSVRLAPAYDVTPTTFYRQIPTERGPKDLDDRLGMFVNGRRSVHDVSTDDLVTEGITWGLSDTTARGVVGDALLVLEEQLDEAVARNGVPAPLHEFVAARVKALRSGKRAAHGEQATSRSIEESSPPPLAQRPHLSS
jgi:serine/threonine-protein kinase HipA